MRSLLRNFLKNFSVGFLLFINSSNALSQVQMFQKTFGSTISFEYSYAHRNTNDGGYIIGGVTCSYGGAGCHYYAVKFDSAGNKEWDKVYSDYQNDHINDVWQTNDGGYLLGGCCGNLGGDTTVGGSLIIRTNPSGDTVWTKIWRNSDIYGILQSMDGDIVAGGLTGSASDAFLVKLNYNTGDTIWTRKWKGASPNGENGYAVTETENGDLLLLGGTSSAGSGGWDFLLLKTDANGNVKWEKAYGTASNEGGSGHFAETADKGFIISGGGQNGMVLIKTDSLGNIMWQKEYIGNGTTGAHGVLQTSDKGYLACGWDDHPEDAVLLKTDSLGNVQWVKYYGGPNPSTGNGELFYCVTTTADGGYAMSGRDYSFEPQADAYIVKTDANGNSGCHERDTIFSAINPGLVKTDINLPCHYGPQTINTPTVITTGYQETSLCYTVGGIDNSNAINTSIEVFPNPFSDEATIKISGDIKISSAEFKIYDLLGNTVKTVSGINSDVIKIERENMSSGIYFYCINDPKNINLKGKLIIQ